MRRPRALTIAGSDSGGGAGIQADLKTFAAHGVYGASVLTSITAQNTLGVTGIQDVTPEMVALQIKAVLSDIGAHSIKTGMLSSAAIVATVGMTLRAFKIKNLVVDPVMISKSGHRLLTDDAVEAVVNHLLPIADVLTPNLHEAKALLGREVSTVDQMKQAATDLAAMGPRCVVVKGGHLAGDPVDVVYWKKKHHLLRGQRFPTRNTHGTGCTFSSAIAANLALGFDVLESVRGAKRYITKAIEASYTIGKGHGPVNHFYRLKAGNR